MSVCVAEGEKIRARIVPSGYAKKNVQFPSKIREVGKRFVVDMEVDAGTFYSVKETLLRSKSLALRPTNKFHFKTKNNPVGN